MSEENQRWQDWSDETFIGYCETHCETPRALFNGAQLNRIQKLAFGSLHHNFDENQWLSSRSDMAECCRLARIRLAEAKKNGN